MSDNNRTERCVGMGELRANTTCEITLYMLAAALVINLLFAFADQLDYTYAKIEYVFIISSIILFLVPALFCRLQKMNRPAHRYILISSFILGGTLMFCVMGIRGSVFLVLPILLSGMYNRKIFCVHTFAVSVLVSLIGIFVYLWIDISITHYYGHTWNLRDIINDVVTPQMFFITVCFFAAHFIARSGESTAARFVQSTEEAAMRKAELETAAKLQLDSFPKKMDIAPDGEFSLTAGIVPAREAAGDFYDFFIIDDKYICLIIGDVSDKGLASAMYMMSARNTLRALAGVVDSMESVFEHANMNLLDTSREAFTTVLAFCIDIKTGRGRYINAGHLPALICHADGTVGTIEAEPQLMLGALPGISFKSYPVHFQKGDTIFLYTDGISEAMDSQRRQYGGDRIVSAALRSGSSSLEKMRDAVFSDVEDYADEAQHSDDRTLLLLRWNGNSEACRSSISFRSDPAEIANAIDAMNHVLHENGCPDEIRRELDSAADDLLTNITDYAGASEISLSVFCGDGYARLVFTDDGQPFDLNRYRGPERSPLDIGGLGISIIRTIADETAYAYRDGKNINSIIKYY